MYNVWRLESASRKPHTLPEEPTCFREQLVHRLRYEARRCPLEARARAGTPPCLIRDSSSSAAALLSVILLYAALAPVGTGATHTMSGSLWKQLLTRGSSWIEPSASPEAWETTAELRRKLLYTHLNALPARWQAAQNEFRALLDKMRAKQVTVEEAGWFGVRCVELYAFYCLGVVIGARSLQP